MIEFSLKHPKANYAMLGVVPNFFYESDPKSAKEQLEAHYIGGWFPMRGMHIKHLGTNEPILTYPGDPPRPLIAEARLHNETIQFYNGARIAVIQPDGSYEVALVD